MCIRDRVSVAEHILASLLAVCRRLPVYRDSQRLHQWKDRGRMKCVRGSTVLVVGAGHIGSTFAAMCQGLGAHTLGLKRTVHGPVAVSYTHLAGSTDRSPQTAAPPRWRPCRTGHPPP